MLITFEGIDGSGKSTQIALLKKELTRQGRNVKVFREPGGTQVSEMIREILLNPELKVNPVTELLLFSAARSQLVAQEVKPLLAKGEIVILDRFYDSTTAYQGYGRKSLPIDDIQQINEVATHSVTPDLTFYLRLTPKEAANRTEKFEKDRMEQSGDTFFEQVYQGFEKMAASEKRFVTIPATDTPEEVHRQIMQTIKAHIADGSEP